VSGTVAVSDQLWSPEELYSVDGGWLLAEGYLNHSRDGRTVFGFFRTLLLEPQDTDLAQQLADERPYPGNDFFPSLPTIRNVLAAEMPWSPRFEVTFKDDPYSALHRTLRRDGEDEGIRLEQVAVDYSPDSSSETGLGRGYDVPSFEFAARFGLRQLPGTVDLVGLDGRRASAVFRVDTPWRGHLLFLRRDLVEAFAGDRRIMQVAWGEREVSAVDWHSIPAWMQAVHEGNRHIWRHIRLLDADQRSTGGSPAALPPRL
jgi:hypothetical protein